LLSAITSNPSIATQAPDATGSAVLSSQTPRFSIQYASYIPVDHIDAPTACYAVTGGNARDLPFYKLYKGDANRSTYRTTQSMFVIPNTKTSNNFQANTGPTRNYSLGSPVNGSTLDTTPSTTDIYNGSYHGADEDNVEGDCWLWNDRGQASTSTLQGNSVTYPSNTQASVNLYGTATDPLEPSAFGSGIKWNITALLDSSSSSTPNLQLSYTHTCYPAHIVKVNGQIVYEYKPLHNALWYLFGCLTDVIPEISGTKNVAIPAH
jgi:hypothetical protein